MKTKWEQNGLKLSFNTKSPEATAILKEFLNTENNYVKEFNESVVVEKIETEIELLKLFFYQLIQNLKLSITDFLDFLQCIEIKSFVKTDDVDYEGLWDPISPDFFLFDPKSFENVIKLKDGGEIIKQLETEIEKNKEYECDNIGGIADLLLIAYDENGILKNEEVEETSQTKTKVRM